MVLTHLEVQVFVQVAILPQVARREQLRNQVDAVPLLILPALKALDDVWVLQVQSLGHFCHYLLQLLIRQVVWLCCDLAPSHINAYLRVKGLVDLLEAATPNHLRVPEEIGQGSTTAVVRGKAWPMRACWCDAPGSWQQHVCTERAAIANAVLLRLLPDTAGQHLSHIMLNPA